MKILNIARFAVVAAVASAIGLVSPGAASASDGGVNWKSKELGQCLSWNSDGSTTTAKCGSGYKWNDIEISPEYGRKLPSRAAAGALITVATTAPPSSTATPIPGTPASNGVN